MQAKALLGSGSTQLGLELLTALGEECEDLDRVRRLALVNVLLPRAREVLAWLGQLLASALEQSPGGRGRAGRVLWQQGLGSRRSGGSCVPAVALGGQHVRT